MAGDLVISTINGQAIGTKNVIINGNFNVNQRGVSGTVTLAAGAYGHDRWKGGASGCTYTFATVANVTTLTISAGSLIQVVEGLNLQSGTYTLSFNGTAQGKIGAGSFAGSGVTGAAVGGTNLNIEFNTGTLSLVQLEKGSTATSFDYRPYGTELGLCQRYYQRTTAETASATFVTGVICSGATTGNGGLYLIGVMRTTPTLDSSAASTFAYSDGAGGAACTAVSLAGSQSNSRLATINFSTGGGLTQYRPYRIEANSSATAYLGFSSEL